MNELKQLKTKLDYYNGENEVPEGSFRISASGIANFFSYTNQWWRENLLGESGFTGNSASVNGSIVHFILEQFAKNQTITADDKQEISNYILKHTNSEYKDYNTDVDKEYIETQYKPMAEAIVNDYLINNMPTHVEPFIVHEVLPNIMVGGSIDALQLESPKYNGEPTFENLISTSGGCVVDYKTFGRTNGYLPKDTDNMDFKYRLQLLTYAWVLKQKGITIDRVRLVYVSKHEVDRYGKPGKGGKPNKLKDYPSTVSVQTSQLTDEDFDYIEGIIKLIAESVDTWNKHPELRYLLSQDYRLKE